MEDPTCPVTAKLHSNTIDSELIRRSTKTLCTCLREQRVTCARASARTRDEQAAAKRRLVNEPPPEHAIGDLMQQNKSASSHFARSDPVPFHFTGPSLSGTFSSDLARTSASHFAGPNPALLPFTWPVPIRHLRFDLVGSDPAPHFSLGCPIQHICLSHLGQLRSGTIHLQASSAR